jgi:hypothetical protein
MMLKGTQRFGRRLPVVPRRFVAANSRSFSSAKRHESSPINVAPADLTKHTA